MITEFKKNQKNPIRNSRNYKTWQRGEIFIQGLFETIKKVLVAEFKDKIIKINRTFCFYFSEI